MKASNESVKSTAQPTFADYSVLRKLWHDFAPKLRLTTRSVFGQTGSNGAKNRSQVGLNSNSRELAAPSGGSALFR